MKICYCNYNPCASLPSIGVLFSFCPSITATTFATPTLAAPPSIGTLRPNQSNETKPSWQDPTVLQKMTIPRQQGFLFCEGREENVYCMQSYSYFAKKLFSRLESTTFRAQRINFSAAPSSPLTRKYYSLNNFLFAFKL